MPALLGPPWDRLQPSGYPGTGTGRSLLNSPHELGPYCACRLKGTSEHKANDIKKGLPELTRKPLFTANYTISNSPIVLVAGVGFEPTTFGL